jgi:hypothetical protein
VSSKNQQELKMKTLYFESAKITEILRIRNEQHTIAKIVGNEIRKSH